MTGEPVVPFDPQALEPAAVARAFGDASRSYEQAARLQQQVRDELLSPLRQLQVRKSFRFGFFGDWVLVLCV